MRLFSGRPDPTVAFLGRLRCRRWRVQSLLPPAARGAMTGAVLVVLGVVVRISAGDNLREVQPGRVYRAAQMTPDELHQLLRARGIRTVVNLRGCCPDFDWYRDECRVTHEANVSQEDVTLSAIRLPAPSEVQRLLHVLDRSEYPILLHCRQGVDRTGLAAVMVKLLEPGVTLAEAQRQLGIGYGYVPYNGTENMRRFFRLYRDWLGRLECVHSPELFRHWAACEYCPGACRAELQWRDLPAGAWPAGRGRVLRVRAHNASLEAWRLRPGDGHGIHARYRVYRSDGETIHEGRAGLFDATVPPGESIDLALGVPPLPPGQYGLSVELNERDQNAFSQFGVAPLIHEFRIGP